MTNDDGAARARTQITAGRTSLGIELGSTRIKACLVDSDGTPLADGSHEWENQFVDRVWTYSLDAVWSGVQACVAALAADVRARHGIAVVYDCHSIRSRIPFLFDGLLPMFSVGTNGGVTCAPAIEAAVIRHCAAATPGMDMVLNGRFRGGWTTRRARF